MYLLTGISIFERFYAYSEVIIKKFTLFNGIPQFRDYIKNNNNNNYKLKQIVYSNDLN